MPETDKASKLVEAVVTAFAESDARPTPEQIENLLRPFAPIMHETEKAINSLLHPHHSRSFFYPVKNWLEANDVVSGVGSHVERRIQFLLQDTCTCVLDYLQKAIEHATQPVDPRISALLDHEYLQEKREQATDK